MPDIMSSIIPGILAPGNAKFTCVAAAIHSNDGRPAAAISVSGLSDRMHLLDLAVALQSRWLETLSGKLKGECRACLIRDQGTRRPGRRARTERGTDVPIPTWTFGELITADDINNWFVPLAACKASDTGRASTTTLTADPDLALAVAANATYAVTAALLFTGPDGAGFFQWDFGVPTGATFEYVAVYNTTTPAVSVQALGAGSRLWANTAGTSSLQPLNITGTLVVSHASGSFAVKWAQHAPSRTATTLKAYSNLVAQRIA